jgi:alginate O-acetyltransferase complex protein AlgI
MKFTGPLFLFVFLPPTLSAFYLATSTWSRNCALLAFTIIVRALYDIFSVVLLLVILPVNFTVARALLRLTGRPRHGGKPYSGEELRNKLYVKYKIVFTLLNNRHFYHSRVGSRQVVQVFRASNEASAIPILGQSLAC